MSESIPAERTRSLLKELIATVSLVCLFGVLLASSGVCQAPSYGEKPDQWTTYASGPYFSQLQKIASAYRICARISSIYAVGS